ncbi:uncharacterized protein ANIA_06005 [Aspergillus nidulans FGSC A4]|uniref:Uncharacterized protein n=1 Tax=Emericella nidulans (strain FGSC A4 / ATCC 38163 / CBS 112.46 / NRRL 194 / M139) TaxID=227321 RepID=C8V341_EMENI|nr:hypothetical protein [Aspergillus nidulans FGSC A4]CBF70377.1 TPA: conserved hypothetical protein [Aspergillus nidulans FGSC A4]
MSAQFSGRQSPPPESQTGAQENSPPGSGRTDPKFAPPPEYAPKSSSEGEGQSQTAGLSSNPKHILEDIEAAKYKKGTGN